MAPLSVEAQMWPEPHAANTVPSEEEVMNCHARPLAEVPVVRFVHVTPPSAEVQMSPPKPVAAANLVPSAEEVTA